MKILFCLIIGISLAACGQKLAPNPRPDEQSTFTNREAVVKVYVATRGSYQYLLELDKVGLCMPEEELPAEFRAEGVLVRCDGQMLSDSAVVYKPGPTDIPEADFKVPRVRVSRMVKL